MIWLTWRQFRAQAWVAAAALAVAAAVLAVTGAHLAHLYDTSGLAACHTHGDCGMLGTALLDHFRASAVDKLLYNGGVLLLYAVPALIGVFWGAPLIAREVEAGTLPLAWNQSITRTRWLAVKLGLTGLAAVATAGLLSLMISWWGSPIDQALGVASDRNGSSGTNRFAPLLFGARGLTPIGYAAFAFALGITAGVLIRRTIPAMATTLAVFTGALVTMSLWVRPHLATPLRAIAALKVANIDGMSISNGGQATVTESVNLPGAWILANQTITHSGHAFTGPAPRICLSQTSSFQACQAALGRLHLQQLVTYQPASRYWAFQAYETAIFLALALALAGICFWRVRRHLA